MDIPRRLLGGCCAGGFSLGFGGFFLLDFSGGLPFGEEHIERCVGGDAIEHLPVNVVGMLLGLCGVLFSSFLLNNEFRVEATE